MDVEYGDRYGRGAGLLDKMRAEAIGMAIPSYDRLCRGAPIISDKQFPQPDAPAGTLSGVRLKAPEARLLTSSSSCPDSFSTSAPDADRQIRRFGLFGMIVDAVTSVVDALLSRPQRSRSPPEYEDCGIDECDCSDTFRFEREPRASELARVQPESFNGLGRPFEDETDRSAISSSAGVGRDERVRAEADGQEKGGVDPDMDAKKLSRFLARVKARTEAMAVPVEEPPRDSVTSCQDKIADLKRLLSANRSVISGEDSVDRVPVPSSPSSVNCVETLAEIPKCVIETPEKIPENPAESSDPVSPRIPAERIETASKKVEDLKDRDVVAPKLSNGTVEDIKPVKEAVLNCEDKVAKIKEMLSKKSVETLRTVEMNVEPDRTENVMPKIFAKDENCPPRRESQHNTNLCENKLKSEKHPDRPSKETRKQSQRKKKNKENRNKKTSICVDDGNVPERVFSGSQTANCDKHHRNAKCSKKHKHKDRQNTKLMIKDDLAFDSDSDVKSPLYFSTETLEIHSPEKKNLKKNNCKLTESIDKCKNFLSNLHINKEQTEVQKPKASNTNCENFDEIKGKFKGSESDSDKFIIVFSDQPSASSQNEKPIAVSDSCKKNPLPKNNYRRKEPSECESEESFEICFVNDNNDCYGNDEVYSDSATETGSDEDDSYSESDETGTDSSGYVEENKENDSENDLTLVQCGDECDETDALEEEEKVEKKLKSCLKKPKERRSPKLPSPERIDKKVKFDENKPKVHKMIVWAHAYQQARIGHWERCARDAERFKQRITVTSTCIDWVLKREHRNRIFFQRFRPILMRAIREEKEAKAKEAKRLKEEEALRIKQEEEAALKIKEEEEAALKIKEEEEAALRLKQQEEDNVFKIKQVEDETLRNEKDGEFLIKIVENADLILNDSGIRDCNNISIPNEMIANG